MRLTAALWLMLAGAASAGPAFLFSGEGWSFPVGQPEVYAFQVFAPAQGGIGLSVTLKGPSGRALDAELAAHRGEALRLSDGDGAVLLETVVGAPMRGRFAVTFADPEAAQRAARRMLGQE